jgi:hypothetical protein
MRIDEEKALRLRRTKLLAEVAAIDERLPRPPLSGYPANEAQFRARDNAYRNTDSNGNYVTPEDNNDSES